MSEQEREPMEKIQKKKVDELVYEQLFSNIRDGIWKEGDKIPSEPELCNELGISRVTLRSSIQRLQSIGLLNVWQGRGTFVTSPNDMLSFSDFSGVLDLTEKEFNEISSLREALEPTSIRLILAQGKDADIHAVETAYFAMKKAFENFDYEEYTQQDYQFHAATIIASRNDVFIQILNIFHNQYFKYFKELNKFMFENGDISSKLRENSMGPKDSHTLVYRCLKREISVSPATLIETFTSGNKTNFARYLHEREKK